MSTRFITTCDGCGKDFNPRLPGAVACVFVQATAEGGERRVEVDACRACAEVASLNALLHVATAR